MKSFLSSLRKLDASLEIESGQTASKNRIKLWKCWPRNSKAIKKYTKKGIPGISLSLYTSLLTIGTSIGIGITFNPQSSWAGSTCVGTYSSRSGVVFNPTTGVISTSTTNSVIGYFNSITNAYVPIANYTGGGNINAIATQPSTGNLFFVNRTTGNIVVYNSNIGTQATLTGVLPSSTTIIGATFTASGKLYVYYTNKTLIEVNPSNGNQVGSTITINGIPGGSPAAGIPGNTPVGTVFTGGTTNGDIAIGTDGVIRILGDTSTIIATATSVTYTSRLYTLTISGNTATAIPVVASDITGLSGAAANGLAIDPATGKFYISSSLGTYELNPNTNSATLLTSATGTNDLAACGSPAPDVPTITKAFGPDNVVGIPANSTLTLTLGNTNQVPIFLIAPLVDNFQTGLTVRSPNGLGGTCLNDTANSNKVTAVVNSSSISLLDGLKIPAGGCTVTVNVTASTVGTFTNNIAAGALKTTAGNNASATTSTLVVPAIDYGDAPITGTAPNGTGTNAYGEARHVVVAGIRLGATIDSETASIANATATGDGADDDGITIPALVAGQTATITAQVSGAGGYLQGWIDWNGNGLFDAGEQIATNIQDNGTGDNNAAIGTISFDVNVPANAITSASTFARFRWSTNQNLDSTTTATDGEVEDYQILIKAPPLTCGTIYGSYNNGGIFNGLRAYNPTSGSLSAQIATLTTPGGSTTNVAALAVDPVLDSNGNRRVYYMENSGTNARLFYYDGSSVTDTGTTITVPYSPINTVRSDGSTGSLNNSFNRMGFAPDGTLYIADGQKTFYRFSPNRSGTGGTLSAANTITDNPNNDIGNFGRAKVGQSGGGDITFDSSGRMYIVTYDSNSSGVPTEFRLFQILNPQSSTPTAVLLGRQASVDTVAGLSFQISDNTLYMQGGGGKSFGWNLATNTVTNLSATSLGSADLGSCHYPDLDPTNTSTKTVANITNPGATQLSANDILEYTLNVTNNGNLVAGNVTLVDAIPAGTTYVTGSTKLNSITQTDVSGAMPYANATNAKQINSPGQASGVLTAGASNKATVVFRVKVNAANIKICNQSNVFYDGGLTVGISSDDPSTTSVNGDQTCTGVIPGSSKAKLLLVKRITAIKRNGETVPETFTTFVDDLNSLTPTNDDNHCNWPGSTGAAGACTNTYTVGKTSVSDIQTGDEVEYTIYYLNGGGNPAKLARICDQLDTNLAFQTQFNSSDITTVGKGLVLVAGNTTTQYLTNTGLDNDKGQLTTPALATSCNLGARTGNNLSDDVVVVDVGSPTSLLMNSTSSGTPTDSYGYIRFKAKVR